jgi:hypothetical protein
VKIEEDKEAFGRLRNWATWKQSVKVGLEQGLMLVAASKSSGNSW